MLRLGRVRGQRARAAPLFPPVSLRNTGSSAPSDARRLTRACAVITLGEARLKSAPVATAFRTPGRRTYVQVKLQEQKNIPDEQPGEFEKKKNGMYT